jgi:ribose 5-phosphate isomerase B
MAEKKNIFIGSDHRGFELKSLIVDHIRELGYKVEDIGCHSRESCDYPVYGLKLTEKMAEGEGEDIGILICGTGIGMSIVANRNPYIRAALCGNEFMAKMSRMHNNANVLVLGSMVIGQSLALEIVDIWLNTEFEGGRHQNRLDMIDAIQ